jgi:radical SAM superfamily enzyme YgiQ (UPF0313 family)
MRTVFVNPAQGDLVEHKGRIYNRTWTPLDLAYCAAVVREAGGGDVSIIDANAERLTPADVAARVRGADRAFVTSTSLDRWQCPHLDLAPFVGVVEAVRRVTPDVFVLGSHGTVKPAEILELTGATAVVRGEPERTVAAIAQAGSLTDVNGISLIENGAVVHRPSQTPVRMDDLPLPALDLLPMERYRYEVLGDRFSLFEMSRGCASACTFCLLETYGVGVRKKSVDTLVREIEWAVAQFGVRTAYFIDLEFTVLRKQVLELCRYLVKADLDLTWCCQTRLDLVDAELLSWMKRAGCRLIHTGVEAGSDRMLELVDKGITLEQIRMGMALIREAGIETACFFMIGFPESTKADMDDIVRLAVELEPTYPLFHITAPYPGTKLYEQVRADDTLRFSDESLFPEAIEARFRVDELKAMTRRAYLRYYTRPRYVTRRLMRGDLGALFGQLRLFSSYIRA